MELLRQVRIIDPSKLRDYVADVLISEGKIAAIEPQINDYPADTKIKTAQNLILGTGLVDLYSHSSEPGHEIRETLADLADSAAAGGFTQLAILPDTLPTIDNPNILAAMRQKSQYLRQIKLKIPQIHFWAAIAQDKTLQQMNELADLKPQAIGFTGRFYFHNLNLLKQVLEYVQPWQTPVAIALGEPETSDNGVVREGAAAIRYGLPSNPGFSEAAAIAAVLEIVDYLGTPVHIMRVSTERGVELIANAKQRGVPVTASTTWMHLLFSSDDLGSYDPNLHLDPPLGNPHDLAALQGGVKQGIIEAIAIDHHAYTYEEKTVAFAQSPPGVIGLQLALPLLWQKLVTSGKWSAIELWQALSSRPRQLLQQQTISIEPQQPAELILFAPQSTWIANSHHLQSTATNTPWYEREINGCVLKTWL